MGKVIVSALILILFIGCASATDLSGTDSKTTSMNITDASVQFTNLASGITIRSNPVIDNQSFIPASTSDVNSTSILYTSGEKDWYIFPDPQIQMSYDYTGNSLKETIILKSDRDISFPVSLSPNSKIIPWYDGTYKVVSATSGDTMDGVVVSKPFGIDANGNHIDMAYAYDG